MPPAQRGNPQDPRAPSGPHPGPDPRVPSQLCFRSRARGLTQEQDQGRKEAAGQRHGQAEGSGLGGRVLSYPLGPTADSALTGGGPLNSPTLADEGKRPVVKGSRRGAPGHVSPPLSSNSGPKVWPCPSHQPPLSPAWWRPLWRWLRAARAATTSPGLCPQPGSEVSRPAPTPVSPGRARSRDRDHLHRHHSA